MGVEFRSDRSPQGWSPNVRELLYLEEGLIAGTALALVVNMVIPFIADFNDSFVGFDWEFVAMGVLIMGPPFIYLILVLKFDDSGPPEQPPQYKNWKATRRWRWVFAVALVIGSLLVGATISVWGWGGDNWTFHYSGIQLMTLVPFFVAMVLYSYTLHRLGVDVGFG